MTKTVTKSDYESGDRGFYTIISAEEWVGKGAVHFDSRILAKVRLILREMRIDDYLVKKFYVHYLANNVIKVYGVGGATK